MTPPSPTLSPPPRRQALWICLLLAAVTLALYWPVTRLRVRHLRRPRLHHRQPRRASRRDPARPALRPERRGRPQLASAHPFQSHAGLPVVRPERRRASFHQPAPAHRQHPAALPGAPAHDRRVVAQRPGRRPVRLASPPCRIGRLDRRAEGRAERAVLVAHPLGLAGLRRGLQKSGRKVKTILFPGGFSFRAGGDVQAHGRHLSFRPPAPGFLAAGPVPAPRPSAARPGRTGQIPPRAAGRQIRRRPSPTLAPASRKNPLLRHQRRFVRQDLSPAKTRRRHAGHGAIFPWPPASATPSFPTSAIPPKCCGPRICPPFPS